MQTSLEMLKDLDAAHERWLKNEIPARLTEIEADPSKGIAAEKVFRDLEAMHQARLRSK